MKYSSEVITLEFTIPFRLELGVTLSLGTAEGVRETLDWLSRVDSLVSDSLGELERLSFFFLWRG